MEQTSQATSAETGFADMSPATGPFVVNLCASVAPIELGSASLPGLERYRVYQVRRVEDNRPRYRLRLGFFADEAATETVLNAVRELYPAAFTVAAASDDLKHAPGFDAATLGTRSSPAPAKGAATTGSYQRIAPAAESVKPAVAPAAAAPASQPTPPAIVVAQVPVAAVKPPATTLELLPDTAPPAPAMAAVQSVATPFRVKAADPTALAKSSDLQLQTEHRTAYKPPIIAPPVITDGPILIDSTQTLRMLTEAELSDNEGPQWFVVQLAVSDQAINLDTMPKLDIFSAFRLYSIAMPQQGKILHSMRLGFFREAVSAEAVAGYLKTFFSAPDVMRVSGAEQTRFAEPPAAPQKESHGSAKVVTLDEARHRTGKPAAPVLSNAIIQSTQRPAPAAPVEVPPAQTARPRAKPANKSGGRSAPKSAVASKTSAPVGKRPAARSRSLNDLLHEEARQVILSESGIRRLEQKGSLLSRLVGKLTR